MEDNVKQALDAINEICAKHNVRLVTSEWLTLGTFNHVYSIKWTDKYYPSIKNVINLGYDENGFLIIEK